MAAIAVAVRPLRFLGRLAHRESTVAEVVVEVAHPSRFWDHSVRRESKAAAQVFRRHRVGLVCLGRLGSDNPGYMDHLDHKTFLQAGTLPDR